MLVRLDLCVHPISKFLLIGNCSVLVAFRIICLIFSLSFSWDGCIMSSHAFHILCCAVKLDVLTTFYVAAGVGLSLVVWPLCDVLGGVIL